MDEPDDSNNLVRQKWVRIMPDYGHAAVWDKQGVCYDVESLPVPPDIRLMLEAWASWYHYNEEPFDSVPPFDHWAHASFGWFLARKVKQALPDWTVIYFDESKLGHGEMNFEIILNPDGSFSP